MSQPPLPLSPGDARSIGPSVGLVEGPQGGLVVVFGFVTYAWDAGDEVSRRLAAVQLVLAKHNAVEVASGFGVSTATLFRWVRSFREDGAGGRVGPGADRSSWAEPTVRDRIVALRGSGLTIRQVAEQSGVSTATVRVALGLVPARPSRTSTAPGPAGPVAAESTEVTDADADDDDGAVAETVADDDDAAVSLTVLAKPAPRSRERAAARAGGLVEAPVVLTEGAQLPLAGLLLVLPALSRTGLLDVAETVFGPIRKPGSTASP